MFRKNLNFGPEGQKGPKNHRKSDPEKPEKIRKSGKKNCFTFYSKSLNSQKKAIKHFFLDHFGPF